MEKPLATLWRNYTHSSRPDVRMQLTVSGGGLKATTREHGLTEYWANRLTFCAAPPNFPRIFCWVYRHEGRKLRHELRCHAVLCTSTTVASLLEKQLKESLALALAEFRKDKISRQNARLSLVNCIYENPSIPRRKILLSTGASNYRPPLERSKSAPKLTIIEENLEEDEEIFEGRPRNRVPPFLRHDSAGAIYDKRKLLLEKLTRTHKVPELIVEEEIKEKESRVRFNEETTKLTTDEESEMILQELAQESMKNDLIESCNLNGWLSSLSETPDLIPDNDDGSLSSGCESSGSTVADLDQQPFTVIVEDDEENDDNNKPKEMKKTDFKVGGCVINRMKPIGITSNLTTIDGDEVSLVPLGESQTDFSSLKVFKKRSMSEPSPINLSTNNGMTTLLCKLNSNSSNNSVEDDEEENASACSDESGYDEAIDCVSSVGNIVLV